MLQSRVCEVGPVVGHPGLLSMQLLLLVTQSLKVYMRKDVHAYYILYVKLIGLIYPGNVFKFMSDH